METGSEQQAGSLSVWRDGNRKDGSRGESAGRREVSLFFGGPDRPGADQDSGGRQTADGSPRRPP